MSVITMREMLEAGVHFGHQTRRWNPRMKPYIYGARNGIHIIDLQKTIKLFRDAYSFVSDVVANGEKVMFVGTKKQARDIVATEATRAGMYWVNGRWLGGCLTNFKTVRQSLDRLRAIEKMAADGTYAKLTKKEVSQLETEKEKFLKNLGGIKEMAKLPGAMFIIDPGKEYNAAREAARMNIPIVAVADTNCDPEGLNFVIPGNDDAIRAIGLFASRIADACLEGAKRHQESTAARGRDTKDEGDRDGGQRQDRRGDRGPRRDQREDGPGPRIDRVARPGRKPDPAPAAAPAPVTTPGEGGKDAQ